MSSPSNCPDRDTLERLLQGFLPDSQAETLEIHLQRCPSCLRAAEMIGTAVGFDTETVEAKPEGQNEKLNPLKERLRALWKGAGLDAGEPSRAGETKARRLDAEYAALLSPPVEGEQGLGRLGGYRVLKLLGAGGMGFVFLADDPKLARRVALKVMKPSLATVPANKERFLREAQATAAVRNDHVIEIYHID